MDFENVEPVVKKLARVAGQIEFMELRQEAYLQYLQIMRRAEKKGLEGDDLTRYIMYSISRGLRDYVRNDRIVGFNPRTLRRYASAGVEVILPKREGVYDYTEGPDDLKAFEQLEGLMRVIETDQEARFVELRNADFSLREIGKELGVSPSYVHRIQKRLRARLRDRFNETRASA